MPVVENLGSAPIPFELELTGTGTAEYVQADLLPTGSTGKVLGVVADCDDNTALSSVVLYLLSGSGVVAAQPHDRDRAYESAALSPAVDAPDAFLAEVVNYPQAYRGLRVVLLATWTGPCTIQGVVHVDNAS